MNESSTLRFQLLLTANKSSCKWLCSLCSPIGSPIMSRMDKKVGIKRSNVYNQDEMTKRNMEIPSLGNLREKLHYSHNSFTCLHHNKKKKKYHSDPLFTVKTSSISFRLLTRVLLHSNYKNHN